MMNIETEDRIISVAMIMMIVGAAMALIACTFAFVALGLTLLKYGTVCEADPCPSGCGRMIETRVAARGNSTDGRIVWESKSAGKSGTVNHGVADTYRNDGKRDGADVGDDDIIRCDNPVAPYRLDGGARNVAKFLPAERSPGEVGGNCRDGGSDTGAERRESCAARHDPLDKRVFHGGDYSKKPGEGEAKIAVGAKLLGERSKR